MWFWERLRRMDHKLDLLLYTQQAQGALIMSDLTQLEADVAANTDAVSSASTLLDSLAQQIRDNANDPAALAALASNLEANNAGLAAAVVRNTPAAPEEPTP